MTEAPRKEVSIPLQSLNRLMPMYLHVGSDGRILGVGPTILRLAGSKMIGRAFFDEFEVRRPKSIQSMSDLVARYGEAIHLQLPGDNPTFFRAVGMPAGGSSGGTILNLSFGIHVYEAVAQHELTLSDFAPTDLTVEMLYLLEAKSAAMEESRQLNQRLEAARLVAEASSITDLLTNLPNRRGFEISLQRRMGKGIPFAILVIDLDFFKQVNDTHGHEAGDLVLQETAARLKRFTLEDDIVARMGGDEFLAFIDKITGAEASVRLAERLVRNLDEPFIYEGSACKIGASIGVAVSDDTGTETLSEVLKRADDALYASKRAGRGQVALADQARPAAEKLPDDCGS